jgi:hypothetical protein
VYPITAQYPAAWPVATMTSAASGIMVPRKKVQRDLPARTRPRQQPVLPNGVPVLIYCATERTHVRVFGWQVGCSDVIVARAFV